MPDDLELNDLDGFTGTEQYHKLGFFRTVATDGVGYVMSNGYSWFVTDAIAIIESKLKGKSDFFSIKLKVENHKATATIDDGNGKVLHKQDYKYTDAKRDITLFWRDGVIMLAGEY